jgi:hypothetical protein
MVRNQTKNIQIEVEINVYYRDDKHYKRILALGALYLIFGTIFLFRLDQLNKTLLLRQPAFSFGLLAFNDYQPLKYFVTAVLLGLVGFVFIRYFLKAIKEQQLGTLVLLSAVVLIFLVIALIILLIIFIDVPIFRAILSFLVMVVFLGWLLKDKWK